MTKEQRTRERDRGWGGGGLSDHHGGGVSFACATQGLLRLC